MGGGNEDEKDSHRLETERRVGETLFRLSPFDAKGGCEKKTKKTSARMDGKGMWSEVVVLCWSEGAKKIDPFPIRRRNKNDLASGIELDEQHQPNMTFSIL